MKTLIAVVRYPNCPFTGRVWSGNCRRVHQERPVRSRGPFEASTHFLCVPQV